MEAHKKKKAGRKPKKQKDKNECCFFLDRNWVAKVCSYNDMDMLIMGVLMGYGAGRNHRSTEWSARSGVTWGEISSWDKANTAIGRLMDAGLVERFVKKKDALGRITYRYEMIYSENSEFICLPDSIVQGVRVRGQKIPPPLRQLKMTGNVVALRLLIDLYHKHELPACGGSSVLWLPFAGETISKEVGAYTAWKFTARHGETVRDKVRVLPNFLSSYADCEEEFWKALEILLDLHLIEIVPHLFIGDTLIHPLRVRGRDDDDVEKKEKDVTRAAHHAVWCNADLVAARTARTKGFDIQQGPRSHPSILEDVYYVPIRKHLSPEVRGIFRLKHRPQTKPTSQWYSRYHNEIPGSISTYNQIAESAEQAVKALKSEPYCPLITAVNSC
jgi:hypothetical protein